MKCWLNKKVNRQYYCAEEYNNEKEAELRTLQIAEMHNKWEMELKNIDLNRIILSFCYNLSKW